MAVLFRLGRSDWGKFSLRMSVSWAGSAFFMDQQPVQVHLCHGSDGLHTCKPQCKPISPALSIGPDLTGKSKFIAGLKATEQGLDSTVAHLGGQTSKPGGRVWTGEVQEIGSPHAIMCTETLCIDQKVALCVTVSLTLTSEVNVFYHLLEPSLMLSSKKACYLTSNTNKSYVCPPFSG